MSQYRNPIPTVDCIIELPGELCFDHGTLFADDLAYKRTGQRRKL
jgi:hypothetical protein